MNDGYRRSLTLVFRMKPGISWFGISAIHYFLQKYTLNIRNQCVDHPVPVVSFRNRKGGFHMERRALIEKANLTYRGTVKRSEEGLPVGNGTMGTMLWTSPASLKMQINRVDVFACGNSTNSFSEPHEDYAYACAYVDMDFAGYGSDVFDETTVQALNVYDASVFIESHGISCEAVMAENQDVLALHVEDARTEKEGVSVRLRALRNTFVRTKSHVALSDFHRFGDIAVLKQEFIEGDYYCSTAVAVKVAGEKSRIRVDNERNSDTPALPRSETYVQGQENETELRILISPEHGDFDLFIASASSFDRNDDTVMRAVQELKKAEDRGFGEIRSVHETWWHTFWSGSFISLWGNEDAEKIMVHYIYFFYIMACCSRNSSFAPNFGGLLFSPRGDRRHWGGMQWWNNLNLMYNAIMPSGHSELIMPYFNMYYNMYDASHEAAKQVWGADGIYIGETSYVWGPEKLPDDIADEMRELMLMRRPWSERSQKFRDFAKKKNPFEPRWNFLVGQSTEPKWVHGELVFEETPYGPVAHVSHIFGSMACLAYQYWLEYEYTGDEDFLREKGYPMIRGVAEFFRTYPNLILEEDGMYHVLYSNHGESFWGGKDTLDTMTGMHGILKTAIHTAQLLGVDQDLVPLWKDLLSRLAPLPTSADTECPVPRPADGSVIWVGARGHALHRENGAVRPNPCVYFDMCTLETENVNPEYYRIGKNTLDFLRKREGDSNRWWFNEMSWAPRMFAAMGEGETLLKNAIRQLNSESAKDEHCFFEANGSQPVYQNRLTAREGINAISAQRLGNVAAGLQMGLLQCSGGAPVLPPVIRVFPAWKKDWNAEFELHARGGFIVSAKQDHGTIEYVRIHAERDSKLRFVNPWDSPMIIEKDGKLETCAQKRIMVDMKTDETICFTQA